MSNNKPFCLMPWVHLHVANEGYVKACCVANINYGNINDSTLEDIWQGDKINEIRQKFLSGEIDKRCAQCLNLEAAGGKSIRQETFEKYPSLTNDNLPDQPTYFDIRFSNVCNFRCRTCWHGASSKWFQEAKVLNRQVSDKAIIYNVKDFQSFIEKTGSALLNAQEIYFAGGEPLVTEEHFLLLEWLIQKGATKMLLRYNTNFSVLKFKGYDVLELWALFDRVEVLASIDGAEGLGEYIRKDFNWTTFVNNRHLIEGMSNIIFKISPTISVYNIKHIPDLYKKCIELKMIDFDDFYINILEMPYHFNIQILSTSDKEQITKIYTEFIEELNSQKATTAVVQRFVEIVDYMNAEDKHRFWPKFINETKILDKLRDEQYDSIFTKL